ncbi:MAG: FAD-dependent oxidoreductase [Candidatus Tectomicrobia bacterium]|uniref:FAD-dependent oxidoreductase n=1 Tax=Tectimicrobiota bacterium TaxID=2528274 RepID=A0A932CLI1_UNCTE|nr:FAD-dependent oxidoreductase [Candidatus Tectomicrobia bacterium]
MRKEMEREVDLVDHDWLKRNIRCQDACPLHTDIPGYIALIVQGQYVEAYTLIRETNPFPSVCSRICHRPCELACLRGGMDAPVAINFLKRFVADRITQGEKLVTPVRAQRDERVAIVGSGPAGLTAAHDLARQGYGVTVFEAQPVAGGMLSLGIPDFRLPKGEVALEIDLIRQLGVEIHLNTPIGRDLTLNDLRKGFYHAILIATGAHQAKALKITGEEAHGVIEALPFLRQVNLGERRRPGERVIVVGDGYAAFDAARVAVRLGSQVTLLCRDERDKIAVPRWEAEAAEEEGIDLRFLLWPTRVLTERGRAKGLECLEVENNDGARGRVLVPIQGLRVSFEADAIINAAGEEPQHSFWCESGGPRKRGVGGEVKQGEPGVYLAGDAATGPRTVVEAIASGHQAAAAICRYLEGKREKGPREEMAWEEMISLQVDGHYDATPRQEALRTSSDRRQGSFEEVELGYDEGLALREASRCLQCNVQVDFNAEECLVCGRCAEVCPSDCIQMVDQEGREFQPKTLREPWLIGRGMLKDDSLCIRCGLCKEVCPVETGMSFRRITWRSRLC